jgi:orotate phosphoribosyltransferase
MHSADRAFIAETTAKMLLEVKAVLFSEGKPFIFTSGWASPVYIDCRKLIFYPRIRTQLVDFAAATLSRDAGFEQFDVIAGGETAGIPYAAWIADRFGLPMQYIRKKPKGFGRNAQIEGDVREGARTLLVEDLTTDGRSKVNFCKALREAGAVVDVLRVVKQGNYLATAQVDQVEKFLNAPAEWSAAHGGVSSFPSG